MMFCQAMYLVDNLRTISKMPESSFDEIIERYVEMNMMLNGRVARIWRDQMLIKQLKICVNWKNINKNKYLSVMRRSMVNDLESRVLLKENLTKNINDRNVFMDGINQSYRYENMEKYSIV